MTSFGKSLDRTVALVMQTLFTRSSLEVWRVRRVQKTDGSRNPWELPIRPFGLAFFVVFRRN